MSAQTEFLLARIAEREAVALAARNCLLDRWWVDGPAAESGKWWVYATGEKFTRQAVADHIALNDPTRVLAECEARRLLIADLNAERHEVVEDCWYTCAAATEEHDGGECCNDSRGEDCDCGRDARVARRLSILAAVYADHPDYPAKDE